MIPSSMRLVIFVALTSLGCKKVDRHPQKVETVPVPSTELPVPSTQLPVPAPGSAATGCVADRVTALSLEPEDRSDCTTGDDACKVDCAAGNASACFFRATKLQSIPERLEETVQLFSRACEHGLAIACTNHGATIWMRDGNTSCARRVFDKACAVNEPFACGMIGRLMLTTAQDPTQVAAARTYLEGICEKLAGPPCKMLANHLESGELGQFDQTQILPLLKRACEGGDPTACQDLQSRGSK